MLNKSIGIGQSIEVRFDQNEEFCEKLSNRFGISVIPVSSPAVENEEDEANPILIQSFIFGECSETSLLDLDDIHGVDMLEEVIMLMFQEAIDAGNIKVGSTMYALTILSDAAYFNDEGELIRRFKLRAKFVEPALVE